MNKIETLIHDAIGRYPWLRVPIVNFYQHILSLIPHQDYLVNPDLIVKPGYFFGFHDKCPWSCDDNYHLAHKFDKTKKMSQLEELPLEYGVFEGAHFDRFRVLGKTMSWNWQQGATLQWRGNANIVLVNDLEDGNPCVIMQTLEGEILDVLPFHLVSVDQSGRYALSYCFARLGFGAPGYGYSLWKDDKTKNNNLLQIIDLHNGTAMPLVKLEDIAAINHCKSMDDAYHFFSHGLFSPTGQRILFYHQWRQKSGILNSRLFSIGINGEDLFHFPGEEFSHIAWRGDKEVLAYCHIKDNHWGYYLSRDQEGIWQRVGEKSFSSDGHPHCTADGRFFITDTYPDRKRQQRLYVFDFHRGEAVEIARLKIPFEYRTTRRCDFHPRWNHDGNRLSFDSAHSGVRALCIMDIGKDIFGHTEKK